jgi:hypothetical protein
VTLKIETDEAHEGMSIIARRWRPHKAAIMTWWPGGVEAAKQHQQGIRKTGKILNWLNWLIPKIKPSKPLKRD